jgi:hypothetical protein
MWRGCLNRDGQQVTLGNAQENILALPRSIKRNLLCLGFGIEGGSSIGASGAKIDPRAQSPRKHACALQDCAPAKRTVSTNLFGRREKVAQHPLVPGSLSSHPHRNNNGLMGGVVVA